MIEAGTVLQNRYRVERQIGQGGMGAVFIATDERFGSTVAIKETLMLDEKFRKAFEREARLLNSLRHPALPRVSDHFIDGSGQFLVMEYIDGEDLSLTMEHEGKTFPVKDVLNWADQLLDALEYLHSQEIPVIHRDIKPQNLKLTTRGQIILLDFGLAKGNPTNPESNTAAKSVFGYSRNYASLEQIQGTGTDPRSDLYSLAATLYHLLTGVPPADALTRAMNVLSDKEDPLIAVNVINAEIPAPIAEVLHKAMALNANQRPASAGEMRQMLRESVDLVKDDAKTMIDTRRHSAALFTQPTAVLADAASSKPKPASAATEVQTKILATDTVAKSSVTGDFDSESTRVRPESKPVSKNRFAYVGAALLGLLIAGTAAGLYVYNPALFGAGQRDNTNSVVETKADTIVVSDANVNTSDATNSNTENASNLTINTAPQTTEKKSETKAEVKTVPNKPAETAKQEPKEKIVIVEGDSGDDDMDVDLDDEEQVNIRPVPNQPVSPKIPGNIPPQVWTKMTPAQRQKLRRAIQIQQQQEEMQRRQREQRQREQQTSPQAPPN